jgi:hypothetical protein
MTEEGTVHVRIHPLSIQVFLLLAACGGEPGTTTAAFAVHDGDAGPPPQCTRDLAELEDLGTSPRTCAEDVTCPCGAYCAFGLCGFDCIDDSECADGEECTTRGQCHAPEVPQGGLRIEPAALSFTTRDAAQRLSIVAGGPAVPQVEVTGEPGLLLECDPTGSSAASSCSCATDGCTMTGIPAGGTAALFVRVDPFGSLPAPPAWTIHVSVENEVRIVPAQLIVPPLLTIEGHYSGTATLVESGLPASAGPSTFGESSLVVKMLVAPVGAGWPGFYRFELRDATRALGAESPDDVSVGDDDADLRGLAFGIIDCSHDPCTWDVRGSELTPQAYGLDSPTAQPVERERDQLGGLMLLRVRGSTGWDDALQMSWQLSLRRIDQGACQVTCQADGTTPTIPAGSVATRCAVQEHAACYGELADGLCETADPSYGRVMSTFAPGGSCDAQNQSATPLTLTARSLVMPQPEAAIPGQGGIEDFFKYHGLSPDEQLRRVGQWAASGAASSLARCELGQPGPEPPLSVACGPNTGADCFALQQRYGCQPVCRCVPNQPCPIQACFRCDFSVSWRDRDVAEEDEPLLCAQRYLCYQPDEVPPRDPDSRFPDHVEPGSYEFTTDLMPDSRDAYCGLEGEVPVQELPTGAGFFSNMARRGQLEPYAPHDLLRRCLNDLMDEPKPDESLAQLFESEGCINVPRFLRAMHWSSVELSQRPKYSDPAAPKELAAQALYHRLIQQWIEIHAFVAREGGQEEAVAEAVAGPLAGDVPTRDELLDTLEAGWRRLFQPRYARPLLRLSPEVLLDPDYRTRPYQPWLSGEENANRPSAADPQAVGLPATLLQGMTGYLEVLAREIEVASLAGTIPVREAALRRAGTGVRYALMAEALASALHARALEAGSPGWLTEWEVDRARFREAVLRVLNRSRALGTGSNPLGIEKDDLPLYFVDPSTSNTQFFAASDYLFNRAFTALANAEGSLDEARDAWTTWYQQSMQDRMNELGQASRVEDTRTYYGQQIEALCGAKDKFVADEILDDWIDTDRNGEPDMPPGLCFLDVSDSTCQVSRADLAAVVDSSPPDDLKLQICLALRLQPGNFGTPMFADPEMNRLVAWLSGGGTEQSLTRLRNASIGHDSLGRVTIAGFALTREAFFGPSHDLQVTTEDLTFCQEQFPTAKLPSVDDLPHPPLARPECFQGQLGDAALAVRSAADSVSALASRIGDLVERYDIAIRSCLIQEAAGAALQAAEEKHDAMMVHLLDQRLSAQQSANQAGVWGGVFGIVGGLVTDNPGMALAGVAGIFEADANQDVANAQFALDLAEEKHDTEMMAIRQAAEDMTCYNEAEAHFVGFRTAHLELAQARTELARAQARFHDMQRQVTALVAAGRKAVDREESVDLPRFAYDQWLDADIDRFVADMKVARRAAYLVAKAAGYEKQEPFADDGPGLAILRATTPDELRDALLDLDALMGDRSLAGQTPEGTPLHVPLCRFLSAPAGVDPRDSEVTCDVQSFQRMLVDPSHAAYDEDGDYIGQTFRFSLMPFGVHIGGEAGERLWSVSAVIDGNANGFGFGDYTWLKLYKRNTFFSQWADGPEGHATPLQLGSNRPCRNLFLEAGAFMDTTAAGCDTDDYTVATLHTPFGDFDSPFWNDVGYTPASTELRGRGLYGEYVLLIPAAEIDAGLLLDRIWDIYLRFTYNRITVH